MDQLQHLKYDFSYKKMFGEYCVYANLKPIMLVCDDTVYIKMLEKLKSLMDGATTKPPYEGSKPHYVLDIEDSDLTEKVVEILERETPLPKPRKKR